MTSSKYSNNWWCLFFKIIYKIFRWYLNRYYSIILIPCYYQVSLLKIIKIKKFKFFKFFKVFFSVWMLSWDYLRRSVSFKIFHYLFFDSLYFDLLIGSQMTSNLPPFGYPFDSREALRHIGKSFVLVSKGLQFKPLS